MIICPNLSNPEVAREFNELVQATSKQAAYHIWSLNNGNAIDKAPNGAESKLFLTLLEHYNGDRTKAIQAKAKTYGKSFLNWFGDWINNDYSPKSDATERLIGKLNSIANSDSKFASLAKLILDNKALPYNLKYFKIDNNRDDIEGHSGMWHSLANLIEVLGNNVSEEEINKVLLHELIHYNTENLLSTYRTSPENVPQSIRQNIKELYSIIDYAKKYIIEHFDEKKFREIAERQNKNIGSRVFYAFDNQGDVEIDEFISEIFTNPGLQEILNEIPYKETKQTLWDKIKECIQNIFGIPINRGSVLEEALKASTEFITKAKKEYDSVSKVVDKNGEPLLIFHTTDLLGDPDFSVFDTKHEGFESAIYGTDSYDMSSSYMDPEFALRVLEYKFEYTPSIPFYVDRLSEEYPDIDWYNFDYESLPESVKEDEYVKELYSLLRLNDVDDRRVTSNIREYEASVIETEINRGDHIEYGTLVRPTRFTKALFANLKNPVIIDAEYGKWNKIDALKIFDIITEPTEGKRFESRVIKPEFEGNTNSLYKETSDGLERKDEISTRDIENVFKNTSYDGVIIQNVMDYGSYQRYRPSATVVMSYSSSQVKSIANQGPTPYEGTFSRENDDIYYHIQGKLIKTVQDVKDVLSDILELYYDFHNWLGTRITLNKRDAESYNDQISFVLNLFELPSKTMWINSGGFLQFNDKLIQDNLYKFKDRIDSHGLLSDNYIKNRIRLGELFSSLQKKFPNIKKIVPTKLVGANAKFENGCVYINLENVTSDTLVEECLHPFVEAIYTENKQLFDNLLKEARKEFPKLRAEIAVTYKDDKFTREDRYKELVTQALSRHYADIYINGSSKEKSIWRLALDWILEMLGVHHIDPKTTLGELADALYEAESVHVNEKYYNTKSFNLNQQQDSKFLQQLKSLGAELMNKCKG